MEERNIVLAITITMKYHDVVVFRGTLLFFPPMGKTVGFEILDQWFHYHL